MRKSKYHPNLSCDNNVKYDKHIYQGIQIARSIVRSIGDSGLR